MNEKIIWDYLYNKLKNPYGVAGLMGNLFAESSLSPVCATNLKKSGYNNVNLYVKDVDEGKHDFANDGVAFGLAQWLYKTRKQGLLDKAKGKSIGDINVQLDYLWDEIQKYTTVINTLYSTESIQEASDIVLTKYEKPANQSDGVKKLRAQYARKYFDKYNNVCVTLRLSRKTAKELKRFME